jgi:hypothetical protein
MQQDADDNEELDDNNSENQHKDADLMRFNHETRELFLVPYLKQFKAVVLRGGTGDFVQYDSYINTDGLGYFMRSSITHFGSYTCGYETGYDYGSEAGSSIIFRSHPPKPQTSFLSSRKTYQLILTNTFTFLLSCKFISLSCAVCSDCAPCARQQPACRSFTCLWSSRLRIFSHTSTLRHFSISSYLQLTHRNHHNVHPTAL